MSNHESELSKRLMQLEEVVTHQERLIQQLNEVVRQLNLDFHRATLEFGAKLSKLESRIDEQGESFDPNEKPPHY